MTTIEHSIFKWGQWEEVGVGEFQFYQCDFVKDFGPWKKGMCAATILISYAESVMKEYDDNGNIVRECKIKLEVDADAS